MHTLTTNLEAAPTDSLTGGSRYLRPDAFTKKVFNPLVRWFTRRGISVRGSRVLEVPGRRSGELRTTPVNLLTLEGERYLVAPRGETEWVRNVRVAGWCNLRLGRRAERVVPVELADEEKPDVLRSYLRQWKWEVGQFFDGVGPDADDEQLRSIAGGYPVFRITAAVDA